MFPRKGARTRRCLSVCQNGAVQVLGHNVTVHSQTRCSVFLQLAAIYLAQHNSLTTAGPVSHDAASPQMNDIVTFLGWVALFTRRRSDLRWKVGSEFGDTPDFS